MEKTRYEGVLYKLNRHGRKVYYARFKVNNKAYLRKIGEEPKINSRTASRLRLEMIDEIRGVGDVSQKKFDVIFDEYLAMREREISRSYYDGLRNIYRKHMQESMGKLTPGQVSAADVQRIVNEMLDAGYAVSTVKQVKDCVSGMYRYVLKELPNIARDVVLPKFDNKIYFTITDEEAARLYDVIVNYPLLQWRIYFSFLLHGRRRGEVVSLKWENVDIERGVYVIDAENNKTNRRIEAPMLPFLVKMLESVPDGDCVGYVVKGRYGGMVSKSGVEHHWTRVKDRAGLPNMRLHDMRHLMGFIGVNNGLTLEEIAYVLGHDSTATTRRYSNMEKESAKRSLEKIHAVLTREA